MLNNIILYFRNDILVFGTYNNIYVTRSNKNIGIVLFLCSIVILYKYYIN